MRSNFNFYAALRFLFSAMGVFLLTSVTSNAANAQYAIFRTNTTIDAGDPTYEDFDIIVDNCTVTINGTHYFSSLTIQNNGVVTHSPNASQPLVLNILFDMTIFTGAKLDVSGKGYPARTGPGRGEGGLGDTDGGGGGTYGGTGGKYVFSGSIPYGAALNPLDYGSGGGGAGAGAGGGSVSVNVIGSLTVNGLLSADGSDYVSNYGGGGAGGSINLSADTFAGNGVISARGGNAGGGGGGGGRVFISTNNNSFSGAQRAFGGTGNGQYGGAGTIVTKLPSQIYGNLLLANLRSDVTVATTDIVGEVRFDNVRISTGASLSHPVGRLGAHLTVTGNLTVDQDASINVGGRGYGPRMGPGAGRGGALDSYCGGAGYGGNGGVYNFVGGSPYGSMYTPTDFGSGGGGLGGFGGGAIFLSVNGNCTINGIVSSDGSDKTGNYGGGGSGGSIFIMSSGFAGNGVLSAIGGAGGGGGGGGRIAVIATTTTFTGTQRAYGGTGNSQYGGAGTILKKSPGQLYGDVLISNATADYVSATTDFEGDIYFNNLRVSKGAYLSHPAYPEGKGNGETAPQSGFHLHVLSNLIIDLDGYITAKGKGFGARLGPGAGAGATSDLYSGGAGHGGNGGTYTFAGGGSYDSIQLPLKMGSGGGGGGGAGGGAIRLSVGGSLMVNGGLIVDGLPNSVAYGGCGSGGSIYVTTSSLTGTGLISAVGGSGSGGGGGGGRIALYSSTDTFTGTKLAYGGSGNGQYGGAGTILSKRASQANGDLVIANLQNVTSIASTDLVGELHFDNIQVTSGGVLSHPAGLSGFHLVVSQNLIVDPDGNIKLDARGYSALSGPGHGDGNAGDTSCGGAGYGGPGGMGDNFFGGNTYGSSTAPVSLGSGGGGTGGGTGGGAVRITVGGTLTVNGLISTGGKQGSSFDNSGGGSGGSIFLSTNILQGTGIVTAPGGNGYDRGGGGGGGRVAFYAVTNTFPVANVRVPGGTSNRRNGGVGTIFYGLSYPISGKITLQGRAGNNALVTFEVHPLDGSPVFSQTLIPAVDGSFVLSGLPAGNYSLRAKASKWLSANARANTTMGAVSGLSYFLLGGDTNNNNVVDVDDLTNVLNVYNTALGDALYNPNADVNDDGFVNVDDLTLVLSNYNVTGQRRK